MNTKFEDDFYRPPETTRTGLMFPARSKNTVRGFTIGFIPAEQQWRQIVYASEHERETCLLLLADANIWNIHEQPPTVKFCDVDGKHRTHRFDFLAEFRNGLKVAIAVKPESRVESLRFRDTLSAIRRDLPKGFADRVCLVTERNRDRWEVTNAQILNFYRRRQDREAYEVILQKIEALSGDISIDDLVSSTKLEARGFRSVFCAIYDGLLRANKRQEISFSSIVSPHKDKL